MLILFLFHILWAGNQTWWIDLQSRVKNNLLNNRRYSVSQIRYISSSYTSTSATVVLLEWISTHVLFGFTLLRWLEVYFQITSMLRIPSVTWTGDVTSFLFLRQRKITTPYKHSLYTVNLSQLFVKEKIIL